MIVIAATPEERAFLVQMIATPLKMTVRDLVGDMPFDVVGATRNGRVAGAVIYTNWRRHSIEMHCAGSQGWLTRENLRGIFTIPFAQFGCLRVWGVVHRKNKKARRLNEKLGFKMIGVLDDEFGHGQDGMIYSMNRNDCRWM